MVSNEDPAAAAGRRFKVHARGTVKINGERAEGRTGSRDGGFHHHIENARAVGTDIGKCETYKWRRSRTASCVSLGYASKQKTEHRNHGCFDQGHFHISSSER